MTIDILIETPPSEIASRRHASGRVDPRRVGTALAIVSGGGHLTWSMLVLFGWAQPLIDFVFWLHFITPPYQVSAFVPARALGLVAFTAGLAYVLGCGFGAVWNRLQRPGD